MNQDIVDFLQRKKYNFREITVFFPEIQELAEVAQNPVWHGEGNVFVHTRNVCESLCSFPEWQALDEENKAILFLAALFHDIGKKICTKIEDGLIVSPHHAVKGAKIFRELFYCRYSEHFSMSFEMREKIAFLIRYHGLPMLFMEKKPIDFQLIEAREFTSFPLLYLLAKADLLGRTCEDQESMLAVVEYFKDYATELGCFYDKITFSDQYSKYQFFKKKTMWQGASIYDDSNLTVYVMSGLPLAGKDTYITQYLSDLPLISLDMIREELKIKPEDGSGEVVAVAKERAKVLLRKHQDFVWNATNTVLDTRNKVCRLCEAYGAKVILIYLEVPYLELLERNKNRDRQVPVPVINHLIRKLDIPRMTEAYEVRHLNGVID